MAAVATHARFQAVGVDVEPAEPLPEEIMDIVISAEERVFLGMSPLMCRCLFVLKEAVYKAAFQVSSVKFIDFSDISINIGEKSAKVAGISRPFAIDYQISDVIIGIAYIKNDTFKRGMRCNTKTELRGPR
ncbi:hypothetical protein ASC97_31885 [Rhizobium sp. Root1203]|nr:hypothetical protein ASC97_31885 [Rhizobium sp. Root1203]